MEREFFTWENWDQLDTACLAFYDCTLIKDIGSHKVGEQFKVIDVDFQRGKLSLVSQKGDVIDEYNLGLVIKE
jgi:hypothetical protein